MKKIFLILALALTISSAKAWEKRPDEGVFLLAVQNMSDEAKAMVKEYLGENYYDDVRYLNNLEAEKKATHSEEIHYLHLNATLSPMEVEGDDALKAVEESLAVVRNRANHSKDEVKKAMRVVINLVCDMHNLSYVRIEGIPHSQTPFSFKCYAGDIGKRKTTSDIKWKNFWVFYTYWHGGFSGALWAEDLALSLGHKRDEFSAGTLREWVSQIGATAADLYGRITPEYEMTRRERNELELLNCEMMAKAGFRLAVLFNEAVK